MNYHRKPTMALAAALAAAIGVSSLTAALAQDDPGGEAAPTVAAALEVLDQVNSGPKVTHPRSRTSGLLEFDAAPARIDVPVSPEQPIRITLPESFDLPAIAMGLPQEFARNEGVAMGGGTVIYDAPAQASQAAVQVLEDGSLRAETVTWNADAPHEFTYDFGDSFTPVVLDDGSATLTLPFSTGASLAVATIDAPWAIDAEDNPVETTYRADGSMLIQTIAHRADTAYPVVSDPRLTFGWGVYLNMFGDEIKAVASAVVAAGGAAAVAVCSGLPKLPGVLSKFAAAVCTAIGAPTLKTLYQAIVDIASNTTISNGKCYQTKIVPMNREWTVVGVKNCTG
ncbi:MAG: hypothetical protein LBJ08_10185 [Bifidobacteriaceae bacterium]|jgi:hypothetical protein|nr:hypothetical protein [Bifidobacteriaceae bacterium]